MIPPQMIYLQWADRDGMDATWCADKINANDVEYVRTPESFKPPSAEASRSPIQRPQPDQALDHEAKLIRKFNHAIDHLRELLELEYCVDTCPWCNYGRSEIRHAHDCPRQAAQAYLDGLE